MSEKTGSGKKKRKIDLSRPLMVMQRKKYYTKPYHKRKYIYVEKSALKSKKALKESIKDDVTSWDDGEFQLKAAKKGKKFTGGSKTVARFTIKDGKITELSLS